VSRIKYFFTLKHCLQYTTLLFHVARRRLNMRSLIRTIIIKPGPRVDPTKGPGPGFYGSTRVNPEIHSFFFLLKAVDNSFNT
jgi:hypothetical protein